MKTKLNKGVLYASLMLGSFIVSPAFSADQTIELLPIEVEGALISYPASTSYDLTEQAITATPYSDSAAYLSSLPGITAGRFGGHGLEPYIRGQSKNQLNIVNDGSYAFGACPSRMDPPSSYINLTPQDEITVVHGYQSVLNGFGGTGGSIIVKQNPPEFGRELTTTGLIEGGYDSNSEMWSAGANITSGTSKAYAKAFTTYKEAQNYEDGNGNEIRSSYTEKSGGIKIGFTPTDSHIYAGVDFHEITDALFAGAGMDSPLSKNITYKAGLEKRLDGKIFQNIDISGYASFVDHTMDNYSLRPLTAMMAMRVTPQSNTYGLKAQSDMILGQRPVSALAEWRRNKRASAAPNTIIDELALAAETTYDLDTKNRLIAGARYDFVHTGYEEVNVAQASGTTRTANDVFQQFYGVNADSNTEHNLGGLLRFEHDYNYNTLFYTGISRAVRTADVIERGLANYMGMGGQMSWVGNPDIDPEQHHQVDIGFDTKTDQWQLNGSAYANIVKDYILRDSARGQDGIVVNLPNADIYRNIDAFLGGFEINGQWDFGQYLQLFGDATYTHGINIDNGDALAQIPPLQGKLGINWAALEYLDISTTMRWATEQTRVDTDNTTGTGRDAGKTNAYAVFDIEGRLTKFEEATLNFGVTNVLDTSYSNHLNRSNSYDATEIQIEEPGRSFYLKLSVPF